MAAASFCRVRQGVPCLNILALFHGLRIEEPSAQRQKDLQQELAQPHAGDQLAGAYSQHEQSNAAGDVIGVGQDKRNDQGVGDNGRDRAQKAVFPKHVSADGAQERRERAEDDVGQRAAGQNIAEKTPDRETGDRGRSEKGHDRERFGETDLDGAAGKVKSRRDHSERGIERCDHSGMSDIKCLF